MATFLAVPRQTYAYRIPGYAGWNHNVLVAGPRKTGKTQLKINLAASLSLAAAWSEQQQQWVAEGHLPPAQTRLSWTSARTPRTSGPAVIPIRTCEPRIRCVTRTLATRRVRGASRV